VSLLAARKQARRGCIQDKECTFHLRHQRRVTCLTRGTLGPNERCARRFGPKASYRDPRNDQLVCGIVRGREWRGVECGEQTLGRVEAPDQEKAPDLKIPRVRGVQSVTSQFKRRPCRVKGLCRPAQVARDERDLCLGDNTPRAGYCLFRTEGARRASQQRLRSRKIAELCHRDTPKRESLCVIAQGDPLQCAERITRRQRTACGCDQRVHRNPVTLVTPDFRYPALKAISWPMRREAMTKYMTGTRKAWLAARLEPLEVEKELTRRSDELARRRGALPWVRIDEEYRFETSQGSAALADLFRGRSQLLIYHFMFGPDYTAGCPSCCAIADGFNGFIVHLDNHDVAFSAVSRAPLPKLLAYRQRMGWRFPWASSFGSHFNADFNVWFTEEQQREGGIEYNYRGEVPAGKPLAGKTVQQWHLRSADGPVAQIAAMTGTDVSTYTRDRPGLSAFALEEGVVYHTYSTYSRGLDGLWGMYQWLDRAPIGRNEKGVWWRRHDEYAKG
jgi:predicted dithiol-disulfide oxidoreductase (DUF899 family)